MRQEALLLLWASAVATAQERVLGVYIFSRHGDRTAKAWPPTNLTGLGYEEVFTSGTYYRDRYISSSASMQIQGMSSNIVKQSQIAASAPSDSVLQNSAQAFLQGLYPPVGEQLGSDTLRNGTVVQTPLNGYQLIPINQVTGSSNSENSAWLQGSTGCGNAVISSNDYFSSSEYMQTYNESLALYQAIWPDVNNTYSRAQTNYKNAYVIWDLLNVASIHNASAQLPDPADFLKLEVLANTHEFNLAYNQTEPVRAITGAVLAGQVVTALNSTLTSKKAAKLNVQFGAYGGMLSYFGLSNLTEANPLFYGIPGYASTLVWELVTNSSSGTPSADEISVRFLFHNGTATNSSPPIEYPLFGMSQSPLPWTDFASKMQDIGIADQQDWCTACGNTTGVCSAAALGGSDSGSSQGDSNSSSSSSGGPSKVVCGVIGAMVTLGVILGVQLLIILLGGLRVVSKKRLANGAGPETVHVNGKS